MGPSVIGGVEAQMWVLGTVMFLFVWIIFVPVAITSRLERIIKLSEELNKDD